MSRRIRLDEAIKISVEIDPKEMIDTVRGSDMLANEPRASMTHADGGTFEKYVRELNSDSRLERPLRELASDLNETVDNIVEGVAIREDKREARAAQHHAIGRVLREWRAFLRELGAFERRFG